MAFFSLAKENSSFAVILIKSEHLVQLRSSKQNIPLTQSVGYPVDVVPVPCTPDSRPFPEWFPPLCAFSIGNNCVTLQNSQNDMM